MDLKQVSEVARDMVVNHGMGEKGLRNQVFRVSDGVLFDKMLTEKMYSEATAEKIDQEIMKLVNEAGQAGRIGNQSQSELSGEIKRRFVGTRDRRS